MITWLYVQIFERFLGGVIRRLDGYKWPISATLFVAQIVMFFVYGPGAETETVYQAIMTFMAEHGHYAYLDESAALNVFMCLDRASKELAKAFGIVINPDHKHPAIKKYEQEKRQSNLDTHNGDLQDAALGV